MTTFFRRMTLATAGGLVAGATVCCFAQQSIGSVGVADATVAGALEVSNGRAVLLGASTVTAKDHTAEIALERGGSVKVCATSGLQVTAGKGGGAGDTPLMLALERGAVEIATLVTANDVVMTPDLRFTLKSAGALDLRLRVARNGDTCVENRGAKAPALTVADQFGESSYELLAGQHVLFEHGSLKEVVDHESEPCGCPAPPVVSVADAGVTGGTAAAPGSVVAAKTAADEHPFPAAVSAGLAPASEVPQAPAGEVHAQVSTTMNYDGDGGAAGAGDGAGSPVAGRTSAGIKAPAVAEAKADGAAQGNTPAVNTAPGNTSHAAGTEHAEAPPPPPAPPARDVIHSIGRFFKRLFGGH